MPRAIQVNPINATISAVISVLIYLPLVLCGFFLRSIVRAITKCKFGRQADVTFSGDCTTIVKGMRNPDSLLAAIIHCENELSLEQLKERFREKILDVRNPDGSWLHPKLRSSFIYFLNYSVSVPYQDFDSDQHFVYLMDKNGQPLVCRSDQDLEDAMETSLNTDVHPDQPLVPKWIFRVCYKQDQGSVHTCIIMHLDHRLADAGGILLALMPKFLDEDPKSDPSVMFRSMRPVKLWQRLILYAKGFLLIPLVLVRTLMVAVVDRNPLHDREGKQPGRFFLAPQHISMKKLREIRVNTGATLNTILSVCLFRGVHRMCEKINDGSGPLKRSWNWTITAPISRWLPGDKVELINRSTGILYGMNSSEISKNDPLDALAKAKYVFEDPSKNDYGWAMRLLGLTMYNWVPMYFNDLLFAKGVRNYTGVFSNVRGNESVQHMMGNKMISMVPYVSMWDNLDYGMVSFSYHDSMTVALAGRIGSFKSREELRQLWHFIKEEIEILHETAVKKVS